MLLRISPAKMSGHVRVPVSKSLLHRECILQFLTGETMDPPADAGDDVRYTANALETLRNGGTSVDCGMSGSTLRFLLPVAMALGRVGTVFSGAPRLLERPLPAPLPMERCTQGLRITERLRPGIWRLPAGETSQLVSGLLMALPLLEEPSELHLTTPMVSAPYVEMTIRVMKRHGVTVERRGNAFCISAPQRYRAASFDAEGDWSAAAWYIAYNAISGQNAVCVTRLRHPSLQGDSCIEAYAQRLPAEIDVSATPDLLPPLALLASLRDGHTTRFTHAGFLRGKECDRLAVSTRLLRSMGAQIAEEADGLTICGVGKLRGGVTVDACGDHRMAMLAAFAGALADAPIMLVGGEAVTKSYPNFWEDYAALGGKWEMMKS